MQILKYPILLLFLCFFITSNAFGNIYDATVSLGNLCEFIGKIQTDDSGATNACSFNPYLSATMDVPVTNAFIFSPEFGLTFPKSGRDESISKMTFFTLANTKYKMYFMHLIAGAGLSFTRLYSSGGTEVLNNGNSTSEFPLPDGAMYTRNFIINAGFGFDLSRDISADIHAHIFNLLTSEDRAVSILFNGTYHFGEF